MPVFRSARRGLRSNRGLHIAVVAMVAVLLVVFGLLWTGWLHDPYRMTAETLQSAEVHIYNGVDNPSVIVPVDVGNAQELSGLQEAWASLNGARRIDHPFSGGYDATLVIKFKDGRVVLIAWRQNWSKLQADYLERSEYGTNVVPVSAAGARSAKMVEYLKAAIARAGMTPWGT